MSDAVGDTGIQPASQEPTRGLAPDERRRVILERVADEQTIHVSDLARELGVSEMTIRRDIRRLEQDGFLRQTYGGATAHLTRALDVAFNARALQHPREKRLIAMRAVDLVADACTIFVGVGTTAEQFARYLRSETSFVPNGYIRKYDGEPFMPHHLDEAVKEQLCGKSRLSVPAHEILV